MSGEELGLCILSKNLIKSFYNKYLLLLTDYISISPPRLYKDYALLVNLYIYIYKYVCVYIQRYFSSHVFAADMGI